MSVHPSNRRRARQRGQAMALLAVAFMVMCGFAGLAIDAGHDYLVQRSAQNAVDTAALAAGKQLAVGGKRQTAPPASSNDTSMEAVNEFASNNGFPTVRGTTCDTASGSGSAATFTTIWTDAGSCSAANGWTNRITVNVPPVVTGGVAVPPDCVGTYEFNCVQVILTHQVHNYLGGIVGIPTTTVSAQATVYAQPPGSSVGTPPAIAVMLFEPSSGFNTGAAPSHSGLSCTNCPTFWTSATGGQVVFDGVNGGNVAGGPVDTVAMQSNGHMVVQTQTTVCDPYNGTQGGQAATCSQNTVVGSQGFALDPSAKIYCSMLQNANSLTGCTTAGPGGAALNKLFSNETSFTPQTWTAPLPDLSGLADCGGLVLNGESVASHSLSGSCAPDAGAPYTIQPGRYRYIVINHGMYEFGTGLFDIYGTAPQNTATGSGYTANGIDHSRETASDFDLCDGAATCGITAGVWIGHGGGSFGAASAGTAASCTGGASSGTDGGGGDLTMVSGSNVSFYFAPNSGTPNANAFVSTNEVTSITLSSPGLNANKQVNDLPMLFDNENSGFIHLDGAPPSKGKEDGDRSHGNFAASGFSGLVYQRPTATGGGVELDPSLSGNTGTAPASLLGQVIAYSLTTFGGSGSAVDFSQGYGAGSQPQIGTSGKNEAEIIGTPAPSVSASSKAGFETFTLNYTDEWALDAYDVYVKVNGGNPVFFSQGVWDSAPPANAVLPPNPNTPGDSNPAYPNYSGAATGSVVAGNGTYTTALDSGTNQYDDWTLTYADGSSMEVRGNWTWGHEKDITNAQSGTNTATIRYTFPTPTGQSVGIDLFMTDGDHCGDYATASYTFNNVGMPGAGQQTSGSVQLEQ